MLSWFEKQIQGEGRQEAQIRLESERQLAKIVSIHKSKGLEYDLVWLPFLAVPSKDPSKKDINIYYSKERDETLWDIENRNLNALCEETFAEELRLLYVALTRAKYQMAFALPTQFDKKWNALHYVLSQGEIGKEINLSDSKDTETLLQAFKEKMRDNVEICTKPNLEAFPALSINTKNDDLKAAEFTGNIEQDWRITSFTSIEQAHRRQNYFTESAGKKHAVFDDAKDYDSQNAIEMSTALLNENESNILDLPRGKQVGTALHRHFENCYFSDLANTEEIDKLRQSLQLDETFTEPLQNWLQQISHTPLSHEIGIALADLANKDCIKEMPFYLAIREHFDVEAFNHALKAHHHLSSEPLQFEQIQGMVRGSIDLVFRHNGKYYLVDYKSNFLGSTLADYNQEALKKEMLHSHYDWQYLIYTLAVHRYLQSVVPHYDYARDFGGVFYLFLRGMNGEPQSGVFYDHPSVELITELDGVF
ncbi:exodeoxyribonuclease V beta chain [Haemophilus influenzae 22.4-21]|uniref:Exodeoxyribonuclease V beta chain n=1 Tax=Haemophilus influenzae 22.4-21 TaxID=375063 RepID=A4NZ45_HAEIF|nr:exodeoxyribonuclease V beta chain [Haemophilus influenzae 22.4-21]